MWPLTRAEESPRRHLGAPTTHRLMHDVQVHAQSRTRNSLLPISFPFSLCSPVCRQGCIKKKEELPTDTFTLCADLLDLVHLKQIPLLLSNRYHRASSFYLSITPGHCNINEGHILSYSLIAKQIIVHILPGRPSFSSTISVVVTWECLGRKVRSLICMQLCVSGLLAVVANVRTKCVIHMHATRKLHTPTTQSKH